MDSLRSVYEIANRGPKSKASLNETSTFQGNQTLQDIDTIVSKVFDKAGRGGVSTSRNGGFVITLGVLDTEYSRTKRGFWFDVYVNLETNGTHWQLTCDASFSGDTDLPRRMRMNVNKSNIKQKSFDHPKEAVGALIEIFKGYVIGFDNMSDDTHAAYKRLHNTYESAEVMRFLGMPNALYDITDWAEKAHADIELYAKLLSNVFTGLSDYQRGM